ncbi:unnamed protein product [Caenorhabditis auriculariae]|uniref:Uncharacterized protein n=1 Tax=Caenorhabditis auriculariae TaxID=2777116 RepID=A0A8S1GV67_9PELO|nr:unnamed protein product [Caenorhabditis auriculariae]
MSSWLRIIVIFILLTFTVSALPSDYVRYLIQAARQNDAGGVNYAYDQEEPAYHRVSRSQGGPSVSLDSLSSLPMLRYG